MLNLMRSAGLSSYAGRTQPPASSRRQYRHLADARGGNLQQLAAPLVVVLVVNVFDQVGDDDKSAPTLLCRRQRYRLCRRHWLRLRGLDPQDATSALGGPVLLGEFNTAPSLACRFPDEPLLRFLSDACGTLSSARVSGGVVQLHHLVGSAENRASGGVRCRIGEFPHHRATLHDVFVSCNGAGRSRRRRPPKSHSRAPGYHRVCLTRAAPKVAARPRIRARRSPTSI